MLDRYLSPGDGVLDIGANDGSMTVQFAKWVGPSGCVLAIEPDPQTYAHLVRNTQALRQVRLACAAVTSARGEHTLHSDRLERKRNSLWAANVMKPGEAIQCLTDTLDHYAAQVPRLKAIKIDAQGAEAHILDGGTATLQRTDLAWMVELWPEGLRHAGRSVREVADAFARHGYHPKDPKGRTWDELITVIDPYTGHKAIDVLLLHSSSLTT